MSNAWSEALARAAWPGRWHQVMHALLRLLDGYRREEDYLGANQIAELTGIERRNVRSVLAQMHAAGLLERTARDGQRTLWRIQKNVEKWTHTGRIAPGSPVTRVTSDPPGYQRPAPRVTSNPGTRVTSDALQRQKDSSPKTQEPRKRGPTKTSAPDALEAEALAGLQRWCSTSVPEQAGRVAELVAECLDHFRGTGRPMVDWVATCRNWIRKDLTYRRERGKVSPIAAASAPPPGVPTWRPDMTQEERLAYQKWCMDAEHRRAARSMLGARR